MEEETRIKQEFAKAFGWYKKDYYSRESEPEVPSWEQIFRKVGKLQAVITCRDIAGNVSELECRLDALEQNIQSEIHPNFPPSK